MAPVRVALIWAALVAAIGVPIALAMTSDLIAWRGTVYILAGFAGIFALGLLLVQPLLIGGYLPGLSAYRARRAHHWTGGVLVTAVVVHVGGLWIASPPDMLDALTFTSPTPFSPFGVVAMWAIFARGALGGVPTALGTETVSHLSHGAGGGDRRRDRGPCRADRGDDGNGLEGVALRAGARRGHKSNG